MIIKNIKNVVVENRELKVKETESRILSNSAAALKDSTIAGAVAIGTAGVIVGGATFAVVKGVKGVAHGVTTITTHFKNRKKSNNGANNEGEGEGGGEV